MKKKIIEMLGRWKAKREAKEVEKLFSELQLNIARLNIYMLKARLLRSRRRQIARDLITTIQKGQPPNE